MTRTAAAVGRSGRARTLRAAKRAVQEATRAAQIQAWQDERARQVRAEEQARAERIAGRETAIRDHTVDYVLAVAAGEEVMAAARRRCEQFRAQAAMAVAGLRGQGLSRADIAAITGLTTREITALVDDADVTGNAGEGSAGDDTAAREGGTDQAHGDGADQVDEVRTPPASGRVEGGDGPELEPMAGNGRMAGEQVPDDVDVSDEGVGGAGTQAGAAPDLPVDAAEQTGAWLGRTR
jgi:hypothetical protein